jgi:hypothetical protein
MLRTITASQINDESLKKPLVLSLDDLSSIRTSDIRSAAQYHSMLFANTAEPRCPVVTLWHSTFVGLTPVTEPLTCQALLLLAMFLYILRFLVPHLVLLQVRKTSCAFQLQQR